MILILYPEKVDIKQKFRGCWWRTPLSCFPFSATVALKSLPAWNLLFISISSLYWWQNTTHPSNIYVDARFYHPHPHWKQILTKKYFLTERKLPTTNVEFNFDTHQGHYLQSWTFKTYCKYEVNRKKRPKRIETIHTSRFIHNFQWRRWRHFNFFLYMEILPRR